MAAVSVGARVVVYLTNPRPHRKNKTAADKRPFFTSPSNGRQTAQRNRCRRFVCAEIIESRSSVVVSRGHHSTPVPRKQSACEPNRAIRLPPISLMPGIRGANAVYRLVLRCSRVRLSPAHASARNRRAVAVLPAHHGADLAGSSESADHARPRRGWPAVPRNDPPAGRSAMTAMPKGCW